MNKIVATDVEVGGYYKLIDPKSADNFFVFKIVERRAGKVDIDTLCYSNGNVIKDSVADFNDWPATDQMWDFDEELSKGQVDAIKAEIIAREEAGLKERLKNRPLSEGPCGGKLLRQTTGKILLKKLHEALDPF